ncbi:MAG: HD domain-containing protein [Peptococcaceae bacterium]|nr:HD domain-containing protein [Peptococcaceae bacterium]
MRPTTACARAWSSSGFVFSENKISAQTAVAPLLEILSILGPADAELLKMASPMHDIGKVGIPDSILTKPGKLTEEEFTLMKTHTEIGFNLLKSSQRKIIRAASIISHQHHEKWNGKGYPLGLKEEEIHIFGRITAVTDVFDALASDRCYKKAWELDRIINLFKEERGKQFDPHLIDVFLECLDEMLIIKDTYTDLFCI